MAQSYIVYNSSLATTAAPVKQPTGSAIRTMMQIAPNVPIKVFEWGCSFDGSAAATPGEVELVDTGAVFATMSTAYVVGDVQTYTDTNAAANTAGSGGVPLGIGSALSGFATTSVTEGSTTVTRNGDLQLIAPTGQYLKQWPLGREFYVPAGHALRVRMTFGTTVNAYCYILFEI
jgi:hypothetical protein